MIFKWKVPKFCSNQSPFNVKFLVFKYFCDLMFMLNSLLSAYLILSILGLLGLGGMRFFLFNSYSHFSWSFYSIALSRYPKAISLCFDSSSSSKIEIYLPLFIIAFNYLFLGTFNLTVMFSSTKDAKPNLILGQLFLTL